MKSINVKSVNQSGGITAANIGKKVFGCKYCETLYETKESAIGCCKCTRLWNKWHILLGAIIILLGAYIIYRGLQ